MEVTFLHFSAFTCYSNSYVRSLGSSLDPGIVAATLDGRPLSYHKRSIGARPLNNPRAHALCSLAVSRSSLLRCPRNPVRFPLGNTRYIDTLTRYSDTLIAHMIDKVQYGSLCTPRLEWCPVDLHWRVCFKWNLFYGSVSSTRQEPRRSLFHERSLAIGVAQRRLQTWTCCSCSDRPVGAADGSS